MAVINKYIVIKNFIDGVPKDSNFEFKTKSLSLMIEEPSSTIVIIVKTLYSSIDPSQLNRMKQYSSSQNTITLANRINPGEVIDAVGVGRVVASNQPEFVKGDLVFGILQWAEYSIVKGPLPLFNKLDPMGFPLSYHLGVLGFSGLTAYSGFFEVCKPKKGEKVFVSTAAGSVGNLVGQYAKLFGCYVVGCTGTDQKVKLLKERLGFDDAFNYKEEPDLNSALKRYFPDGIDIYFDNVGSEMLEAVAENMNIHGRIAVCGAIGEYASTHNKKVSLNLIDIIYKSITIQGFLVVDYLNMYKDFVSVTSTHICSGKIDVLEDVSGLESVPTAFIGLFRGDNVGKKIVKISD